MIPVNTEQRNRQLCQVGFLLLFFFVVVVVDTRVSQNDQNILDLVRSYHLDIGANKAPGIICAVGALEYIFDKYGYHVLDWALRLCVGTWEGEAYSLTANMLKGVARIVAAYGDSLREDAFIDRVGQYSVKVISRNAKDRRAGALGFAEAMIMAYNRKSKYRLSLRKLYGNSTDDDYESTDEMDSADGDDNEPESGMSDN